MISFLPFRKTGLLFGRAKQFPGNWTVLQAFDK